MDIGVEQVVTDVFYHKGNCTSYDKVGEVEHFEEVVIYSSHNHSKLDSVIVLVVFMNVYIIKSYEVKLERN